MPPDRKFFWLTWFLRIVAVFGTSGSLFGVYMSTFVSTDVMDSCGAAVSALAGASIFFSTFPSLRIHIRASQLRKQLGQGPDSNNTSIAGGSIGASIKDDTKHKIILITMLIIAAALIVLNFVLGWIAYLNSKDLELFIHMVVVVATVLGFNSFLLIYLIDERFKELERVISQYRKDQTSRNQEN